MKKGTAFFLIILFIGSFFIRFSLSYMSPVKYWDETIYANLGRNLLSFHEYSFLHGFADFSPNWPLAGFRPPLLPILIFLISIFSLKAGVLNFIIPIISSAGAVGMFFLCRKLLGEKAAVYSSLIFAFFPLSVFWGSKILTDSLFLTLAIFAAYFFWTSFFEDAGYKHCILFGVFSGMAFLSRYSFIWFFPVFFISLWYYRRSLKFLYDKKFILSSLSFLILVIPWFVFNYFSYGGVFGFLIHANESTLRWGGQSFFYYFWVLIKDFWIFAPLFIIGLFYCMKNRKNKQVFFLIAWLAIIFLSASLMTHKEDRYLLPVLPVLCCFSGYGLAIHKKYRNLLLGLIILFILAGNFYLFNSAYHSFDSESQQCLFKTMDYLKNSGASYVVTEHFSPVYFYSLKPNIWVNNYTETMNILRAGFQGESVYYYYVDGDWFNLTAENSSLKEMEIYSCENQHVFILN